MKLKNIYIFAMINNQLKNRTMKKISLLMTALLISLALNAQVSVWDGTAEPWTNGSGTQEDPYLIENAQQLAYLAAQTNELHYNNYEYHGMYADTCFLLTVDLDLGGKNGLEWIPIAQDGVSLQTRCFSGIFDGGNHVISNMNLTDGSGREFMGLFGYVKHGIIKNIVFDGDSMIVSSFNKPGGPGGLGMIIGYGESVTVTNCVNMVDTTWEQIMFEMGGGIGGLFGRLINSTITNCHNLGDINAPDINAYYSGISFGGIGGALFNCDIANCSNRNYANITMENGNDNFGEVLCGGIAGRFSGTITNCFNIGNFNVTVDLTNIVGIRAAGGIVGSGVEDNSLIINNSYSVSSIVMNGKDVSSYIGGIAGFANENMQIEIVNSYYRNTVESSNNYGTPKTDDEMKTQEFVDLLNCGGNAFIMDPNGFYNYGYPMLDWYYDHFVGIVENESNTSIVVYPNPTQDYIRIELSDNASCQSVTIYSIDGRLVFETQDATAQPTTINVANLKSGVYIIKVKLTDGNDYVAKIVKE